MREDHKTVGRRFRVALLVLLQVVVLLPLRFTDGFGERDSYRMFLGLSDTLKSGALFNSSLLYNRDASFGYYGFFYGLSSVIGTGPLALISAMNWLGLLSVTLLVIPQYIVTERLFGERIALAAGVVLIATPVWWNCGLYGHPITTALCFFFGSLAILCRYRHPPPIWIRVAVLGLLTSALTFRFDVALLFIALVAVLAEVRQMPFRALIKESLFYIVCSLTLFGAAQLCLPSVTRGDAPPSILSLLARFENPSDIASGVRESIIALAGGFSPVLLLAVPVSMWMLFRSRRYPALVYVSGVVVINVMFWFPNSSPPRHYLMMAPAMSISGALVAESLARRMPRLQSLPTMFAGFAAASCIIAASLALGHRPGHRGYVPSQFEQRVRMKANIAAARRTAEGLVSLPPLATRVVVLCDSNLVITEMEKIAADTSAIYRKVYAGLQLIGLHDVRQASNQFVMLEQSWDPAVVAGFDQSGADVTLPVLVAPYLPLEYQGGRLRLAVGP